VESDERGPAGVRCIPVRLLSGDDFPPRVEVELVDVDGRAWRFVDKVPIFAREWSTDGQLPVSLVIRCEVLAVQERAGCKAVLITTARPDGVGSELEDTDTFVVWLDQLVGGPSADPTQREHHEVEPGTVTKGNFVELALAEVPELQPVAAEHLADNDELLLHLLMADIRRFLVAAFEAGEHELWCEDSDSSLGPSPMVMSTSTTPWPCRSSRTVGMSRRTSSSRGRRHCVMRSLGRTPGPPGSAHLPPRTSARALVRQLRGLNVQAEPRPTRRNRSLKDPQPVAKVRGVAGAGWSRMEGASGRKGPSVVGTG
jgi:hypothetical protein